jgi:hypothetical protein
VADPLALTIPSGIVEALKELVREAVRDEFAERLDAHEDGFLDVEGAADFLSSTHSAIRSLVKRDAIPFCKAPNGRLLFDRDELRSWAISGSGREA